MAHSNPVNLPASGKYVKLYVDWTAASTRANILTGSKSGNVDGEALATSMGKIAKWYTDFKVLTFTDLTTASSGSGNAVTALSYDNATGKLTFTKGSTFLTQHPTITTDTDTTSTAAPAHGGTFTAIDSVTRDTNGHVKKVNTKTVTLPAQYSHPTYTRSNTTSTASPTHGGTFTAIDSITTNSLGHVTAVNTKTVTLPTDQNTDTKVTQTNTTDNAAYRVLLSGNANDTTETTTSRKSTRLQFYPANGVLNVNSSNNCPIRIDYTPSTNLAAGALMHPFRIAYKNTDGTATHYAYPISVIGNDATGDGAAANYGIRLGSTNGTTIVGAGESSQTFAAAKGKYNDENLYLVADGSVLLYRGMSNDSTTGSGPWTVGGFTATPTSGQVMIADGTVGGYKTSGYTIAKSVPSDAVFTDISVTQSATTTTNYRPLVLGGQNSTDVSTLANTVTNQVYTTTKIYAQPSTGNVYATEFVGKLYRAKGGTWINARDNAAVINDLSSTGENFVPIGFAKSSAGGWAIGTLSNRNKLYLSYTTDANHSSGTNTSTHLIEFPEATGTVALTNHTHNYIPLTGSNAISGSLETNSQNAGFISPGSDNRKMSLIGGGVRFYPGTSSWATGISYYNGNSVLGGIGAYGTNSPTCDYFYMGKNYNDAAMRVENNDTGKMTLRGTLPQLKFQQTTSGSTFDTNNSGIIAYPANNTSGMNMTIQSGGNMIIGSGEYPTNFYNATKSNSTTYPDYWSNDGEQMYVGSDNNVIIHTNANTIGNRKGFMFTTAGNLQLAEGGGIVFRYATANVDHKLVSAGTTTARTWTLPNATGTIALTSNIPGAGSWAAVGYSNMTDASKLSAGTLRYRNFRDGLIEICGYIKPASQNATFVLGTVAGIKPSTVPRYSSIYNGTNMALVTGAIIYIDTNGKIAIQCTSSSVLSTSSNYYFTMTYLTG